jgi:hypothetical protein
VSRRKFRKGQEGYGIPANRGADVLNALFPVDPQDFLGQTPADALTHELGMDLKQALKDQQELNAKARFFMFQVEEMYGKRESELLQQFMVEHGEIPEGNRGICQKAAAL